MPTAVQTIGAQLDAKRLDLQKYLKEHESGNKERPYKAETDCEKIKADMAEIDALALDYEKQSAPERAAKMCERIGSELAKVQKPDFLVTDSRGEVKTFGEVFVGNLYDEKGKCRKFQDIEVEDFGSPELKAARDLELKTTMTTGAGWAPATIRSNRVSLIPMRVPIFMDILPTIPLNTGQIYQYMQETTFTNNADAVPENTDYPESALAAQPVNANVVKVGTLLPITEEQLSDVDGMRAYADNRLSVMVMLAADGKLLNATGGTDINGFYNQVTQSYALSAEPVFDAIFRGMNKVRTLGFANPDAVVLHPNDFVDIRLARTEDGLYIMGNPDVAGSERLFGLRVVQTTAATENTALVGDFGTHSALITRWGFEIRISDSHGTNFGKDVLTLKARIRLGLVIFRLLAFCKVTGI